MKALARLCCCLIEVGRALHTEDTKSKVLSEPGVVGTGSKLNWTERCLEKRTLCVVVPNQQKGQARMPVLKSLCESTGKNACPTIEFWFVSRPKPVLAHAALLPRHARFADRSH